MTYPFDSTGVSDANTVTEEHNITSLSTGLHNYIVPVQAPFFAIGLAVVDKATGKILVRDVDYRLTDEYEDGYLNTAKHLFGSITFLDQNRVGTIALKYQTLGGPFDIPSNKLIINGMDTLNRLSTRDWKELADVPAVFPPTHHTLDLTDVDQGPAMIREIIKMREAMEQPIENIKMSDIADLEPKYIEPLMENLNSIASAILDKAAITSTQFVVKSPGRTPVDAGIFKDGEWTEIPLATSIPNDGVWLVARDINIKGSGLTPGQYKVETRTLINDAVIDMSYANNIAFPLTESDTIKLQCRVLGGNTTNGFISSDDHSSSLTLTRLS